MATFEGRFSDASGLRIGVIVARFNDLVTAKLLSGCLDCLKRHGIDVSDTSSQLDVAWVPGSFELPIVAQQMARSRQYQVLITLGAVIRGDTPHFDVVVAEASKGLLRIDVAGSLDQPRVNGTAFPELDGTMERILRDLNTRIARPLPRAVEPLNQLR